MTDRGFHESCGTRSARDDRRRRLHCNDGYVRLMDTRYEVRDDQYLAGSLADEELIDPQRIGAVGGSYGGGLSMALGGAQGPRRCCPTAPSSPGPARSTATR